LILKELDKDIKKFNKKTKKTKNQLHETVRYLQADLIDTGHYYVQSVDYLREIAHCLNFMVHPAFEHIDNNHSGLDTVQTNELSELSKGISALYKEIIARIKAKDYQALSDVIQKQQALLDIIREMRIAQIKRLKEDDSHTRTKLLYLDIIAESKNLLLYSINLLKSQRDFIIEISK